MQIVSSMNFHFLGSKIVGCTFWLIATELTYFGLISLVLLSSMFSEIPMKSFWVSSISYRVQFQMGVMTFPAQWAGPSRDPRYVQLVLGCNMYKALLLAGRHAPSVMRFTLMKVTDRRSRHISLVSLV